MICLSIYYIENSSKDMSNIMIMFLSLQPAERLNVLLNLADIHLLPQRADVADLVMPSKLAGMMASGRPVVATAKPGTQIALALKNCGLVIPPGSARIFAESVLRLADFPATINLGEIVNHDSSRCFVHGSCQKIDDHRCAPG